MTAVDVSDYRGWLYNRARILAHNPADIDELAQEGAIALWQAAESYDPASGIKFTTYILNTAKWRMAQVFALGNYLGKPSQQGRNNTARTNATRKLETVLDNDLHAPLVTVNYLRVAVMARHGPEIRRAVEALPRTQSAKVYAQFWRGETDRRYNGWWYRPNTGARDQLRERLSHLRTLVD